MILPQKKDAIHKAWFLKVLTAIADDVYLASVMYFKGGTCASLLGWLDRFSVDLDFDYAGNEKDIRKTRDILELLFTNLELTVKDQSQKGIQYFLRYEDDDSDRKTLKIDTAFPIPLANTYATMRFQEIDRILTCQTKETMFSNKLVAVIGRYNKLKHIAGRDIYDVNYFLKHATPYSDTVIRELTGKDPIQYFAELVEFIKDKVTDKIITDDLNMLLPPTALATARRFLKQETLVLLDDEIKRRKAK